VDKCVPATVKERHSLDVMVANVVSKTVMDKGIKKD
jgi:hypothetical protein